MFCSEVGEKSTAQINNMIEIIEKSNIDPWNWHKNNPDLDQLKKQETIWKLTSLENMLRKEISFLL